MKHPFSRLFGLGEKELPIEKEMVDERDEIKKNSRLSHYSKSIPTKNDI